MPIGYHHTLETKIRISNSLKGHIGWKHSDETKLKLSEIAKKRIGEKSNRWIGGKSKCIDCKIELSGYKQKRCQKCYGISERGTNHPNWKNAQSQEYKNKKQTERRHKLGISKKYRYECLGEYKTRIYKNRITNIWKSKNQEHIRLYRKKYKALRKNAGKLSIKTIQMVYEDNIKQYGTLTCYLCRNPIEFRKDQLEHKIPISRGGTNEYQNLAIACCNCNYKKHSKTLEEFENKIGEKNG